MEVRRGTVQTFDSGSYRATVQIAGSLTTSLGDVAVARNIPAVEMQAGRNCCLVFFDETNPSDAVLVAVYT